MPLKYKITEIEIDGYYFLICSFKDKNILPLMKKGLDHFFVKYKKYLLQEKCKKELASGYLSISGSEPAGNSSGRK